MDSVFIVKFFFFIFLMLIFTLFLWFGRGIIGNFLDKVSSFPILRDGASYKYKNFQNDITYEGQVLWTFFAVFVMFILGYLFLGINFSLMLIFPIFFASTIPLLRIRTFSDNNILPDTGMGYDFTESWILSLFGSFGFSLVVISFVFNDGVPLYLSIIGLILTIIVASIPMFPDFINKFLSYDIRSKRGRTFLWIVTLIGFVILWTFLLSLIVYY